MMKKQDLFQAQLQNISIASWLLKLIPIPVGILTAELLSDIVSAATEGSTGGVIRKGGILLLILVLFKFFEITTGVAYQKAKAKALHKCKINLYRTFLTNPMHVLYAAEYGGSIEKLNDDFDTVTGKNITLYPEFWIGILTAAAYETFLAYQNELIAGILLGVSLLQIIPPVIVKKYMQVNYDENRDIEAKLTEFQLGGYRGFATIKLYHLKQWWLDKLSEYHKKYNKIGNKSIYTYEANTILNKFIAMILQYGTYAILGILILVKKASWDTGIQAIALSESLYAAVNKVFSTIPNFAVVKVAEKRIGEWFIQGEKKQGEPKDGTITLSEVRYSFDYKKILEGATVMFPANQISIIRGENGIGKSTLFRLITGMLSNEKGDIRVGNVRPEELRDTAFPAKLFYLPQADAAFDFTPYELYEMVDENGLPAILSMTEKFLLTEKDIKATKIKELSGGERKKVFLSLAFALDPEVLLLDEPTNSLDVESKEVLLDLLMQRKGGTLIITHDAIFDQVAACSYLMENGGISCEKRA